eukprot:1194433-Prorocentrum_minimum.AAC.10
MLREADSLHRDGAGWQEILEVCLSRTTGAEREGGGTDPRLQESAKPRTSEKRETLALPAPENPTPPANEPKPVIARKVKEVPPPPEPRGERRSGRLQGRAATAFALTERLHRSGENAVAWYESEEQMVKTPPVKALVLFSGSGSVEGALRRRFPGVDFVSLDIDPKSSGTNVRDIRQFVQGELFEYPPGHFDLVWASPPCTEYSRALTSRARDLPAADHLVAATLACLVYLKPNYKFIENPDGLLRTRPLMLPYQPFLHPVSYCRYGTLYRKNTSIWSNAPHLLVERCTVHSPCAAKAKWGYHPCTAQAGPTAKVPGSGLGKRVYAVPQRLLQQLFATLPL